jgi:hypothetical protein
MPKNSYHSLHFGGEKNDKSHHTVAKLLSSHSLKYSKIRLSSKTCDLLYNSSLTSKYLFKDTLGLEVQLSGPEGA